MMGLVFIMCLVLEIHYNIKEVALCLFDENRTDAFKKRIAQELLDLNLQNHKLSNKLLLIKKLSIMKTINRSTNLLFGLFIILLFALTSCAEAYDVCPAYSYDDIEKTDKNTKTNL